MQQGAKERRGEEEKRGGLFFFFCLIPAMARLGARRQDLKNQLPDIITVSEEPPLQESPGESPPLYSPPPPVPRFDDCDSHIQLRDTQHLLLDKALLSLSLFHLCGCFIYLFTAENPKEDKTWDFSHTLDLFFLLLFPHLVSPPTLARAAAVDYAPLTGWGRGRSAAQAPTWRLKPTRSDFGKCARPLNLTLLLCFSLCRQL